MGSGGVAVGLLFCRLGGRVSACPWCGRGHRQVLRHPLSGCGPADCDCDSEAGPGSVSGSVTVTVTETTEAGSGSVSGQAVPSVGVTTAGGETQAAACHSQPQAPSSPALLTRGGRAQ